MPPAGTWRAGDPKTSRLCAIIGGFFLSYLMLYLYVTVSQDTQFRFGDFFALWSYPQFLRTHPAAGLYDFPGLKAAQLAMGMETGVNNPFPYPPFFLFFLWPLQKLSYDAAYLAWMAATFALYLGANWPRERPILLLIAVLAPTTTINFVAGQSGFLSAALLVGGLRAMRRRPTLAGLLFGLLTYKPQFGLLLPVALLADRQWRCIAAACATTALLAGAATLLFGTAIWADWLHALPAYNAWFDTLTVRFLMPTVTANLELLGVAAPVAAVVQVLVACGAALLVWLAFRRFPRRLAIATLLVGTCLATPHAFIYDLPMLSSAVLLVIRERLHTNGTFKLSEIAILLLALAFPAIMAFGARAPVSSIAMLLFAALVVTAGVQHPRDI